MIRSALGVASHNLRRLGGRTPLPRFLTWTLNFRCNARCSMCDSWRKGAEGELDTDQALSVVSKLPRSISAVRLTGGEPFLREDLGSIVHGLEGHLRPDLVHLTSNGFLTRRIGRFLEDHRRTSRTPVHLLVSLDGPEALHNEIRGREFAFAQAVETLRMVAANRRSWNVKLAVNQTIVDERGIAQHADLADLLAEMGVDHHVVVAYRESATYSVESGKMAAPAHPGAFRTVHPIDRGIMAGFLQNAEAACEDLPWASRTAKRYYLEGIRNRVLDGFGSPNPPCAALGGHMRILPNGDIPVCQFNTRVAGNILREDFESVWYSDAAVRWREWVGKCPGCWAECEVLPNAILSGDILSRRTGKAGVA